MAGSRRTAASSRRSASSLLLVLCCGAAALALTSAGDDPAAAAPAAAVPKPATMMTAARAAPASFASPPGSVSASSQQGPRFNASLGMDGSNATAWISGSPLTAEAPQWIQRTFDAPVTVSMFRIGCAAVSPQHQPSHVVVTLSAYGIAISRCRSH